MSDNSMPVTDQMLAGSGYDPAKITKVRVKHFSEAKKAGMRISALTAYDALTARILDESGVDILLVGDSIGMVALGYDSTLQVTMQDIEHAVRAVKRGTTRAFVLADMPFGSYETGSEDALRNAVRLVQAGAEGVKLEGGARVAPQIKAITEAGIPVCAHLGYTPQSINALSGPHVQGRGTEAANRLIEDAKAVEKAGAFALVLEMVPVDVSEKITTKLSIPTIGIGAGPRCDGQILVWSDMAGMTEWTPSFAQRFAEIGTALSLSATAYVESVQLGRFPSSQHYFRR